MKHLLTTLIITCTFLPKSNFCQHLINASYVGNITAAQITLSQFANAEYDVDYYKLTYNTIDVHGNPTIASGMVAVPLGGCSHYPLLTYHHGTVLKRTDVPSHNNFESLLGKIFASKGYIVSMPDYLGLGDNPGLHPYVHAESEATASIDLMRATREFVLDSLNISDNGQVFLTGYSQGGHASMATHKYIQDNNLTNEFSVVAGAPASGPYNMSGSQSAPLIDNQPYSNPGYIVYLLMSYNLAYGTLYNNLSDVLQAPYDTLVIPYFDGTHEMGELNPLLPSQLNQLLTPSFLNAFVSDTLTQTHPLWQALLDNDNYDWKPDAPVRLFYCTADEQVNFNNALDASSAMNALNAPDVKAIDKGNFDHGNCVAPAMRGVLEYFDSLQIDCTVGIPVKDASSSVRLYPNPIHNQVTIDNLPLDAQLTIYNIKGQMIYRGIHRQQVVLHTEQFNDGLYWLQIVSKNSIEIIPFEKL